MKELTRDYLEQRQLVAQKTNAVYDPEFTRALRELPWGQWLEEATPFRYRKEYLKKYDEWIKSSSLNAFSGLDSFAVRHLTSGTTQSFDEFYFKHAHRRLRILRGEYAYHRRVRPDFVFIEDAPLEPGDSVIVSVPFCSTGAIPENFCQMLDECAEKDIPVLVDCAYFGTCYELKVDFEHKAIESVCFSLTKGIGLGDIRSGIRFSKVEDDLPIAQQNRYDHTVLAAARIGLYMMNIFPPDFVPTKYRDWQIEVCERAGIKSTPCVHIALGDERWKSYEIDERYRRIGIRELLKARRKGEL